MVIAPARPEDLPVLRAMFLEYERAIGVSLCFQDFPREVRELPGAYVPPRGGLWLAREGDVPAGCVALRPLGDESAELKRLYVRPAHRGGALGRALVRHALDAALAAGYREVKLDTLPTMGSARKLYESMGFRDCAPYNDNPVRDVRFMALSLRA